MTAKKTQGLMIPSALLLAAGTIVLVEIPARNGSFCPAVLLLHGSLLASSGILGCIAATERRAKLITLERMRSLAALNTATGLICMMCAVVSLSWIGLMQAGPCEGSCTVYMGLGSCNTESAIHRQTLLLTADGIFAVLSGAFALIMGVQARREAGLLMTHPDDVQKCDGVLVKEADNGDGAENKLIPAKEKVSSA